eukprot:TRINITY_DN6447_c0_g3_i2.p4 TRINITY_DN6447_c0_g3~~TRINITY_DN6447_c0_g3_i2.p4  ORF type:complete len:212 (-),score=-7.95 TRINITY_DN6447_c0_g3_i2:1957-2592(-)
MQCLNQTLKKSNPSSNKTIVDIVDNTRNKCKDKYFLIIYMSLFKQHCILIKSRQNCKDKYFFIIYMSLFKQHCILIKSRQNSKDQTYIQQIESIYAYLISVYECIFITLPKINPIYKQQQFHPFVIPIVRKMQQIKKQKQQIKEKNCKPYLPYTNGLRLNIYDKNNVPISLQIAYLVFYVSIKKIIKKYKEKQHMLKKKFLKSTLIDNNTP